MTTTKRPLKRVGSEAESRTCVEAWKLCQITIRASLDLTRQLRTVNMLVTSRLRAKLFRKITRFDRAILNKRTLDIVEAEGVRKCGGRFAVVNER